MLSASLTASTPVLSFRPSGIRACAASGDRRSKRKVGAGGSWWTPLFGWPAELDYIEGPDSGAAECATEKKVAAADGEAPSLRGAPLRSVAFTEEKARRLRMMTAEASTFHDAMYHSAIAARLASDFSRGSDH